MHAQQRPLKPVPSVEEAVPKDILEEACWWIYPRRWDVAAEAGSYSRRTVSLSLRLKDLLGPVTRVTEKKK